MQTSVLTINDFEELATIKLQNMVKYPAMKI